MNIFLFGKSGQIGNDIFKIFSENGDNVIFYSSKKLDISNIDHINEYKNIFKGVDFIINCAAYTAVDKAEDEKDQALQTNHIGVKNLCMLCKELDLPLIHLSTDYVFSGEKEVYSEIDETLPLSVYGISKELAEKEIIFNLKKYFILRVSWVFGKYGNNFVKTILKLSKEKESLNIVADQKGCPTSAKSIAQVIYNITKSNINEKQYGIYHYSNSEIVTWYDFAKKIVDIGNKYMSLKIRNISPISTSEYPCKATRPKNSVLSCKKINDIFQIEQDSWEPYLEEVISNYSIQIIDEK
ncbi:dTDP-4-dehydrorhamnose reductase [Silvanigrella paludirubra]|uniref:dTDP-4-dehydrorhamnose reductase n=1 Tax=Silvanigrella paludirubra TaxID=2499159 RepID=A0A6N6VQ46_9BACT|nr:dTDP-4-dehydrorhamnose reductase [Silvanigrella paludirubra]KAB8036807.1 dTDP-4-dehydrorhamnose reductase [Silvanigrella paludirubra]